MRLSLFRKAAIYSSLVFSLFALSGCSAESVQQTESAQQDEAYSLSAAAGNKAPEGPVTVTSPSPGIDSGSGQSAENKDGFSLITPDGVSLQERIQTPGGYARTVSEDGSFDWYVRNYPMDPDGSPILLYDGRLKSRQDVGSATFSLPVIPSADLQQCADSVMRMYAEYFWHTGQYDKIRFHFVSGFLFDYPTYRDGGRVKFDGSTVKWQNSASYNDSYEAFEDYLYITFAYSSTLSMEGESTPADINDVRIGDIFLKAGSPGHVVMVADVCENAEGEKAFLLAQSYMPAQQFYVLKNPLHDNDPWYYQKEVSYPFSTPEYTFSEGSFRRLNYID